MRVLFFLIFIISFSVLAKAKEPRIYTTYVFAQGGESIDSLLFDTYKLPVEVLYDKHYIANVKRWNWFVENPNKLKTGERVYIELPYRYKIYFERLERADREIASAAFTPKVKYIVREKKEKKPSVAPDYVPPSEDINLSIIFTSSKGSLNDVNKKSLVKGDSTQDSPITIGLASTFKSNTERLSYSTSFYASYLVGAAQNQTNDVDIPLELGANFYWNYNYKKLDNVYIGFDAERFSSFNIETLQNGDNFFTKEHSFLYLTFGYFNLFNIFGQNFFFKTGISQSLASQTNVESSVDNSPYSGIRGIAFISTNIFSKVSMHFLAKQHLLSGPSELTVTRYGVGFSYQFF